MVSNGSLCFAIIVDERLSRPLVNGVALANKEKTVFCLGSDGSQQEGNDAEAARLAVAQGLNVKLLIDDNDVTIAGHPSDYLKGYDVTKVLEGHGLKVIAVQGEDIDSLWGAISSIVTTPGPAAVISKRVMAPGIADIEGSTHGHDVIPVKSAIKYLESRGYSTFGDILLNIKGVPQPFSYIGSTKETGANRAIFGDAVNLVLDGLSKEEAAKKVMVIDSMFRSTFYSVLDSCSYRRLGGVNGFESHPPKASRGLRPIWYHGTRKLLRCCRIWIRA